MSRGLGKLQRTLLAYIERMDSLCTTDMSARNAALPDDWFTWSPLELPRGSPTVSQMSSASRALYGLARRGLIAQVNYQAVTVATWRALGEPYVHWVWCSLALAERERVANAPRAAEQEEQRKMALAMLGKR